VHVQSVVPGAGASHAGQVQSIVGAVPAQLQGRRPSAAERVALPSLDIRASFEFAAGDKAAHGALGHRFTVCSPGPARSSEVGAV